MGFLCFGSNSTMCFLAVDFHGGVGGSAPSPSWHSCCLSAEGLCSSPARSEVWSVPGKQLCFVGSPAQPMLQQESLGGVRPPSSSDLLLLTSSHSLSEQGKAGRTEPTSSQQGCVCPDGCISWHAGDSGVAQQSERSGRLRKRPCISSGSVLFKLGLKS